MGDISRRSVAKGAAWAAPVIVATTAIPAYAASLANKALDGWVNNSTRCTRDYRGVTSTTYEFNGTGVYPTRGLWVSGAREDSKIEDVKIIQYLGYTANPATFQAVQASQWTTLTYDPYAPKKDGYLAYSTAYTGSWRYDPDSGMHFASSLPYFRTTLTSRSCVTSLNVVTYRQVVIDGQLYSFERSGTLRAVQR